MLALLLLKSLLLLLSLLERVAAARGALHVAAAARLLLLVGSWSCCWSSWQHSRVLPVLEGSTDAPWSCSVLQKRAQEQQVAV